MNAFRDKIRRITKFCLLPGLALAWLGSAQAAEVLEFETRVELPNGPVNLADGIYAGADELIIRWATDQIDQNNLTGVITRDDLTYLAVKLDDSTPELGGVFVDEIIVDGILQPHGYSPARVLEDVLFAFDLDSFELLRFRNILTAPDTSIAGTFYEVDITANPQPYEVVEYRANVKKEWEAAQLFAEQAGGHLAIITSLEEDQYIHDMVQATVGNNSAWIGGKQDDGTNGYFWVNGDPVPNTNNEAVYANWLDGQANDLNGTDYMAVNQGGKFGWNGRNKVGNVGAYVIEYPDAVPVVVIRYKTGVEDARDQEAELIQRTAQVSGTTVRNMPVPTGTGTMYDIDTIEGEAGQIVQGGLINVDVCVTYDPREPFIISGDGRETKGNGKATGSKNTDGGTDVFNQRDVTLAELAGTGLCTGPLDVPDDTYATWEDLLGANNLVIPARFRGFKGELDLTPDDDTDNLIGIGVFWTIAIVRTDAEFDGPNSVIQFDAGVDYSNQPLGMTPACDNSLPYRNFYAGGTVTGYGEFPNVEGNFIIKDTAQCNAAWSMTRRSTHIGPLRLEDNGGSSTLSDDNIEAIFNGIDLTIQEAAYCSSADLISSLQGSLAAAEAAFTAQNYPAAIANLEQLAFSADDDDLFTTGAFTGFNSCPTAANYRGNLAARGITGAFTVWDRYLNADVFELYPLPARFDDLKPDLRGF